jgi:hypothetical protein
MNMSARRAVAVGHLVVDVPVALLIGGAATASFLTLNLGWALAVILVATALAWLWWAFSVPRWRRWAINRGSAPEALQRIGQRTGLLWPEGSLLSRTEFRMRRP